MIQYVELGGSDTAPVPPLFEETFAASEGADEGAVIRTLAEGLLATTPAGDLRVFGARDGRDLAAAIVLTRLRFDTDEPFAYLLSPVAVRPAWQGQGVGTALIRAALDRLRQDGAQLVMTYGDPAYYGRFGFDHQTSEHILPPHPLQQPVGWIGLWFDGTEPGLVSGRARCAPALDDSSYW